MKIRMKKTARQNKTKKRIIIFVSLIFYLTCLAACEQSAGPLAGTGAQSGGEEPEWWETWEEPEEEELPPPVVTGISVAKKPDTTFYALGQEFAGWDGLTVLWDWSDGHHEEVEEYTLSPDTVDTSKDGSLDIAVQAGEYTTYFDLYVSRSTSVLQSISVKTPPTGLYLGEPFNTTGMAIEGTYTGNKTGTVSLSAVSVEGYDSFKRADQTVTLRVNDKTTALVVRPRVKPGSSFFLNEYTDTSLKHQETEIKPAYIKGMDFDLAGSNLKVKFFRSSSGLDLILTPGNGLYPEDIKGYNKDKAGKQTLTVDLDGVTKTVPVYVLDAKPDVWFDYGFMRHGGDPEGMGAGFGKYHVEQNKTLVLAPVRYLIGWNNDHTPASGTTYSWTVSGGGDYDTTQPQNEEFFTFTPKAAGTYTVRVEVSGRNYVDGMTVTETATTEVISFAHGTKGAPKTWGEGNNTKILRNFAPGQFTGSGSGYGWSLGSIGGYAVWTDTHREVYAIGGNEFGTWYEPGIVWFQEDNNGNGVPDEMWYEVKGPSDLKEPYRALITRRYAIRWADGNDGAQVNEYGQIIRNLCWADSKGRSGLMGGDFPRDWGVTGDWVTYTCTLIADRGDISNGNYNYGGLDAVSNNDPDPETGHKLGYVDAPNSFFYIDSAMDAAGNRVTLTNVRFVKVQTAAFVYGGIFGEFSTEVARLH
jgi:hypothetical protein